MAQCDLAMLLAIRPASRVNDPITHPGGHPLLLHVPLSMALLVLLFTHALMALRY